MTPEAKARVLSVWEAKKSGAAPDDGSAGGYGDPDPSIIPLCDRINEIEGVCTLQSCAGHEVGAAEGAWAHLWLWMSRGMSRSFDARAFELASSPLIERVERIYGEWGQEVTSLTFAGEERSLLSESGGLILRFLHSLEG